ncbi:MAG TPA: DUF420 domain-containing protein, partial [Chitinophagaceae bacterium]|nr:DUF420 domain-containing protein [Chitinophagaceae bacterium]
MSAFPEASIKRNDKTARLLILAVSVVVFMAVVILKNVKLDIETGFNVHIFATVNAVINSVVSVLLLAALIAVKKGNYKAHRSLMIFSIMLSVLFLVSYIAHHLLSGNTAYGGTGVIRYL